MPTLAAAVGTIVLYLGALVIVAVPLALWRAYALSVMWGWFVAPTFGVAPVPLLQMYGLVLFAGLVTYRHTETKKDTGEDLAVLGIGFLAPLISLGFGYALRYWVMGT